MAEVPLLPQVPTISYGPLRATRAQVTAELLAALLRRLPATLWNQDPDAPTPQRELLRILAEQMALHLETRTIMVAMHLLLEAEGRDLDLLLADFGLRRYLQRPDAYARQVAMAALFRPKATMPALEHLADLLFAELPHTVLRTGNAEVHILVADSAPITTAYSYWMLTSREGWRTAVTVHNGFGWISDRPPPGLDITPPGPQLAGFQVLSDDSQIWYVTVEGDTLHASLTPPTWGPYGTTPFQVLDGAGGLWTFQVLHMIQVLNPVLLSSGNPPLVVLDPAHPFQAVSIADAGGGTWWLWVLHGIPFLDPVKPSAATDVTPPGGPWRWLRLYGPGDSLWYAYPSTVGIWQVSQTSPGGPGTNAVQELGDADGTNWRLGITPALTFGVSDAPRVDSSGMPSALMLRDFANQLWYWRVHQTAGEPFFEVSDTLWPRTVPAMPWGSIGWLSLLSTNGLRYYVYPQQYTGVPVLALGPPVTSPWGWSEPIPLRDETGQEWLLEVRNEVLYWTAQPRSDLAPRAPLASLRDVYDVLRYVRGAATQVTVLVS